MTASGDYPSPHGSFKAQLEPFAEMYVEMLDAIQARIEAMPDEHLFGLVRASDEVSTTNCWWVVFRVAPVVREVAQEVLSDRGRRLVSALIGMNNGRRPGDG